MSASFYELLKYAKTGIASPDMTYYDKMMAKAMFGGGTQPTTKTYVYQGTDGKVYQGTDGKVYSWKGE